MKYIKIAVTEQEYERIKEYANAKMRSMSNLIRYAIFRYISQYPCKAARTES